MPVDNEIYKTMPNAWWDDVSALSLLRISINPVRFGYFQDVLRHKLQIDPKRKAVLDVGCGGGLLAEEFARLGCTVTGVDPAEPSLEVAREHASQAGLDINYVHGAGERLPFEDVSFDIVYCCDVLEHVDDVDRVIAETARVLRPSGIYLFDTINRTLPSKLVMIKLAQEWGWSSFMPPNLHEWNMFITPDEIKQGLAKHNLAVREIAGAKPVKNPLALSVTMWKHKRGKMSLRELGESLQFRQAKDTSILYMGYAVKSD